MIDVFLDISYVYDPSDNGEIETSEGSLEIRLSKSTSLLMKSFKDYLSLICIVKQDNNVRPFIIDRNIEVFCKGTAALFRILLILIPPCNQLSRTWWKSANDQGKRLPFQERYLLPVCPLIVCHLSHFLSFITFVHSRESWVNKLSLTDWLKVLICNKVNVASIQWSTGLLWRFLFSIECIYLIEKHKNKRL